MSVISYLKKRADDAVLSSGEESSINTSINAISTRLSSYFESTISEKFRFGSSTRQTILPRSMDERSDIDYMVVFSSGDYTPQTYLDRLKRFAEKYYFSSEIKQSSPSVVLQLNHIKFDLVPALTQQWSGYKIPNGPTAWQDTNPNEFNSTLNSKHAAEFYLLKPAIRLVKYWNACSGYVFDSYSLEKYIVTLSFPFSINIRDYVFTIFDNLNLNSNEQWRKDKLARAKSIIAEVRNLERNEMPLSAEMEVKKLIPE
jgi:hypothetical protein